MIPSDRYSVEKPARLRARHVLYAALAWSLPSAGHCSSAAPGKVSNFVSGPDGIVIFSQAGSRSTPPACSDPVSSQRWALDTSNAAGMATLNTLMVAEASGTQFAVVGTDTCPTDLGVETLLSIQSAQ